MSQRTRTATVGLMLATALALVLPPVRALTLPATPAGPATSPSCGPNDRPETGLQGDVPRADQLSGRAFLGYNCGLALVGYNDLGHRGGNANMAWSDHCAYVAGVNGVAVVDVADPANPVLVSTLHGPGSDFTLETITAMTTADRAVLVAGRYGNNSDRGPAVPSPMDIYDVSDCAHPQLKTTYNFPKNIHNLTLTADARHVWTTMPVQYLDLTDLAHPTGYHDLDSELTPLENPFTANQNSHEAWPSPDGTRLYIGSQVAGDETFRIIDISKWPAQSLTRSDILSEFPSPGHSIRPMSVGGRTFLVNSDESIDDPTAKGCLPDDLTPFGGVSRPRITEITDERHPQEVGQFRLAIAEPENCGAQVASGVNPSVHYQDVDSYADTTFAMVSSWNSGLRVADVRDPSHPTEVAYFNPGQFEYPGESLALDKAWGHVRYLPETGQIWMATETGGFWVLQLENGARTALGLTPSASPLAATGSDARPASTQGPFGSVVTQQRSSLGATYCTLSVVPGTPT
jgi:hypothetical protein